MYLILYFYKMDHNFKIGILKNFLQGKQRGLISMSTAGVLQQSDKKEKPFYEVLGQLGPLSMPQ